MADEIKPIEEIENNTALTEPPVATGVPEPESGIPQAPKAPTAALPPAVPPPTAPPVPSASPAVPQVPSEPGKKAVIKRSGGEGGWVKYVVMALVVLFSGAGVFYYFFYQVTFEINPGPTPGKIVLDNNEIKPGTFRVRPGAHTLDIEKEGYISYISSKKYSFGEKIILNFKFQAEKSPTLSVDGGRLPSSSSDKKLLFFLDKNSVISVLDLTDKSGKVTPLSNAEYPTAKILKISKNTDFALLQDTEAVKVVNFNKTDLVNQSEIKLPPLVSGIHSLTWNNDQSQNFPEANSKILYDLETTSGWDVYLANLAHTTASIILQVDPNVYPNLYLDWGDSPNKILITGGEIGILDIPKREYQKIAADKQFVWGKWGPGGERAVAIDKESGAWVYQNGALERLPFNSAPNLIDFIDKSNIAAVSLSRPVKYNFDTRKLINYAEVKDLSQATSLTTRSDVFYFETVKGIYSARFETSGYK